jgi:hypothetical protein
MEVFMFPVANDFIAIYELGLEVIKMASCHRTTLITQKDIYG